MKVVIDTNCLLVTIPYDSKYYCLWEAFLNKKFVLCYSNEIMKEYEELLYRFYSPDTTFLTMELLSESKNVIKTIPYYKWNLIPADPDDNKFVDCAVNARADYIVTNDKHFNVLKKVNFPFVQVIDIDTFMQIVFGMPEL